MPTVSSRRYHFPEAAASVAAHEPTARLGIWPYAARRSDQKSPALMLVLTASPFFFAEFFTPSFFACVVFIFPPEKICCHSSVVICRIFSGGAWNYPILSSIQSYMSCSDIASSSSQTLTLDLTAMPIFLGRRYTPPFIRLFAIFTLSTPSTACRCQRNAGNLYLHPAFLLAVPQSHLYLFQTSWRNSLALPHDQKSKTCCQRLKCWAKTLPRA